MDASYLGSQHQNGVIRVVLEADEIVALCVEGDFDVANAAALGDQIERVLENGNDLILDLTEATFIDSSVIHVLVRSSKAAAGRERALVLQLGTTALVERVIEIAEIERVLPRAHGRQEAVRIIRQRGTVEQESS